MRHQHMIIKLLAVPIATLLLPISAIAFLVMPKTKVDRIFILDTLSDILLHALNLMLILPLSFDDGIKFNFFLLTGSLVE